MAVELIYNGVICLWGSLGMELMIFAVTVVFAIAIKKTSDGRASRGTKVESVSTESRLAASMSHPTLRRGGMVEKSRVGGFGVPSASLRTQKPSRHHMHGFGLPKVSSSWEPWRVIDEIMSLMQTCPNQESARKALQLYADLRSNLVQVSSRLSERSGNYSIIEAVRRSRHSAIDLFTTLVQCAVRSGHFHLVDKLIEDMIRQGVARTFPFYESAMKQLAGQKQYHLAMRMYDRLQADGMEPSAVTCSCLIRFATEVGEDNRAIDFFQKLLSMTTPSIRAYMTMLRVYARQHNWKAALETYQDMQRRGVPGDSLTLNVVLATGIAVDKLEEVEALLEEADGMPCPISDLVSYNTILKGYAQRGDVGQATRCMVRMRHRGLTPNAITFNTMMDAAVRGQQIELAWAVLTDMRSSGFSPDKFTCSIFTKGILKQPTAANVEAAIVLFREAGSKCDATLQEALRQAILDAASQGGNDGLVLHVQSQLRQHGVMLTDGVAKKVRDGRLG